MAKRRKRKTSRKKQPEYPGWAWGVFGLAVGLSVAAAVWVSDRRPSSVAAQEPASLDNALDDNGETTTVATAEPEPRPESRFDFYEMLPSAELIVSDVDPEIAADVEPQAVVEPGRYVLQAGSFTEFADAERRRAELALQGIEAKIQRVTIDDRTFHRVRIGPTSDLDELNMLRSRLRAAKIDVLRIRFVE
ncbi:MAG: SPOR domain-containing protein [Woeseiaceae bacterium]|nr:SPOR domain-containing protein [Woeseiaceae bacterium]